MLELRAANWNDAEKEYAYIAQLPENENGFTNPYIGITRESFMEWALPRMINYSRGIDLPEGYVPCTEYFLWRGDDIVGLFRLRHILNDTLRNGSGHIGYGIKEEYRGHGYASLGLKLAINEAKKIIDEKEIYMSVNKNNAPSLRVQLKNGAYIHHEDEKKYYTRIKI